MPHSDSWARCGPDLTLSQQWVYNLMAAVVRGEKRSMHFWHLLPIRQSPGWIRIDADAIQEERRRATYRSEYRLRKRVIDGCTSKVATQSQINIKRKLCQSCVKGRRVRHDIKNRAARDAITSQTCCIHTSKKRALQRLCPCRSCPRERWWREYQWLVGPTKKRR